MNDEQTAAIAEKFLEQLDAIGAHALGGGQWAFEQLVVLYVMYGYRALVWAGMTLMVAIILATITIKILAYLRKTEFNDEGDRIFGYSIVGTIGGVATFLFLVFAAKNTAAAIIYLNVPEAKVLQYLIGQIT